MKCFSLLSVVFLILAMLLFTSPVVYADDPPDEDSDTKVDIEIDGDLEVDIRVSGPAELNVGVEGPSQVHIDADDEVELNVQASDDAQVFTKSESWNEPPGRQGAGDEADYISWSDNKRTIMSIVFPLTVLLVLLPIGYIRTKRLKKRNEATFTLK